MKDHVPTGVVVGQDGSLHITNSGNHRVVMLSPVRTVEPRRKTERKTRNEKKNELNNA